MAHRGAGCLGTEWSERGRLREVQQRFALVALALRSTCHALTCLPCPSEAKNKLKSAVTQGALSALTRNASLFGQIAGAAGGAGANEQLGAAAV